MCGIVAYVGPQDAAPILLEGLQRLEYRGYDSAGLAVVNSRSLKTRKVKGRVADLANVVPARFTSPLTSPVAVISRRKVCARMRLRNRSRTAVGKARAAGAPAVAIVIQVSFDGS